MALIIGDMRHTIVVKQLTTSKDEYGSAVETYSTFATLRASIKQNTGSKVLDNKEIFNTSVMVFSIHYRSILTTMQIEFRNEMYRILDISEIGFKEGLSITAELINT